jgi:hypothetical protein
MSERRRYRALAEAERRAAQLATTTDLCRAHVEKAREYDWIADTEPYDDPQAPAATRAIRTRE